MDKFLSLLVHGERTGILLFKACRLKIIKKSIIYKTFIIFYLKVVFW